MAQSAQKKIALMGASLLAGELSARALQSGYSVLVIDPSRVRLESTVAHVRKIFEKQKTKKIPDNWLEKMQLALELKALDTTVQVVVDCLWESPEIKKPLFKEVETHLLPEALILIQNEGVSVTDLAGGLTHSSRVLGVCFIEPLSQATTLEVIRAVQTTDAILQKTLRFFNEIDLKGGVANDFPGGVLKRIQAAYLNEAINTLYEGVASAEDIDNFFKQGGMNYPLGPLSMADWLGLDRVKRELESLYAQTGQVRFLPSPLLVKYVEAGYLGRKSKRGFFQYD